MSERGLEALSAAVKALRSAPQRARQVFVIATEDDPDMADAWLGRVAAGDRSLSTLARLAALSRGIGADLRSLHLRPVDVGASFDIEYVRLEILDEATAQLAYAAALIDAAKFDEAHQLLGQLGAAPKVAYYVAGVLAWRTQRWPDVLTAVDGCAGWARFDPFLAYAASLLEAWAAANLGLFDRAVAAAEFVEGCAEAQLVRDAMFCRALVARATGDEDTARALLTEIRVRWPDFERAKMAVSDATFGLTVTDPATIDTRTDRWDPATETNAAQRAAAESANTAREMLAEAEESLAATVGMDAVKKRIARIKADSIVRVLRQRKGLPTPPVARHILMVGPPGVGKTLSARVIANMFCGLGLLPRPDVYETTPDALKGDKIGEAEKNTRELLERARGATVFLDEFGDLIHEGFSHGDPYGQAIIGALVPWMENHRDETVFIGAGYPMACQRVLRVNPGLQSRLSTIIEFQSYTPDELIAIAEAIVAKAGDTVEPGVAKQVLAEPLARYYSKYHTTAAGDVVRVIDVLGNARFIRTVIDRAQEHRSDRLVNEFGLAAADLADEGAAVDIGVETLALLSGEDLAAGLHEALPPGLRGVKDR